MDDKERLKLAKEALESGSYDKDTIEYIFPELKESGDEMTRNEIIAFVEQAIHRGGGTPVPQEMENRWIAWLEKKSEKMKAKSEVIKDYTGEENVWNNARDFRPKHMQRCLCYDKYMSGVYCYVYDNISKYWCTQTTEEHDPDGENHICDYADYRVTVWMRLPKTTFYLQKQGEQKEINLVEILKHYPNETELYSPLYGKLWLAEVDEKHEIITCYKHHLEEGCTRAALEQEDTVSFYSNGTTGLPDFNVTKDCMLFLHDITKQGEQKYVDKHEPKFKIGDFIANDYCSGKVIKLTDDAYLLDTGQGMPFSCEHNIHLWSINDARDCDVLSDGTTIFIFKDLLSDGSVMSYCDYDTDSGESDAFCPLSVNLMCSKITPAAKEQRDTLMKAIADAGYIFDFESKELKKIEQKPVDIVEPKFHKGDWIITNKKHIWRVDETPDTTSYLYRLINQYGKVEVAEFEVVDKKARLWTIKDARNGDVLVDEDNNIGIYKEIEGVYWHSYIYIGCDGKLRGFSIGGSHEQTDTCPASKEQRDALMKALTDKRYTFDFKKKELKKIEQKPAWSEGDESICRTIINGIVDDKSMCKYEKSNRICETQINWLKSLKDRYAWKPSEEQVEALEHFVRSVGESGYASPYDNNTKLLYSLLTDLQVLQKQGEQKHVNDTDEDIDEAVERTSILDLVEPKFHEGNWVVQKNSGVYKVIEICKSWYEVIDFEDNHYSISFDKEHMCHLWSINDAKNGDILACNGSIFIFKEEYMAGKPTAYCGLINGVFHVSSLSCWTNEKCYPATKEQQDSLFSKMKESGWSWNPTTKELSQSRVTKISDKDRIATDIAIKTLNHNTANDSYCKENCKGYQETGKCYADWACEAKRKADVVKPIFKIGDEVYNRFDKSLAHVIIEYVDETTYYGDTTNFDIIDQDQYGIVRSCENCKCGHYDYPTVSCYLHRDCGGDEPIIIHDDDFVETAMNCKEFEQEN